MFYRSFVALRIMAESKKVSTLSCTGYFEEDRELNNLINPLDYCFHAQAKAMWQDEVL